MLWSRSSSTRYADELGAAGELNAAGEPHATAGSDAADAGSAPATTSAAAHPGAAGTVSEIFHVGTRAKKDADSIGRDRDRLVTSAGAQKNRPSGRLRG